MNLKKYSLVYLCLFVGIVNNAYSFHSITEILPSNKILVCKDFNEVRNGQKVEVYKKKFSYSRSGIELTKTAEFNLPSEGQKIDLYHQEFHREGRMFLKQHEEKIGTATIISPNLVGEKRNVVKINDNKLHEAEATTEIISEQEEQKIRENCIVAQPDMDIDLKNVESVAF